MLYISKCSTFCLQGISIIRIDSDNKLIRIFPILQHWFFKQNINIMLLQSDFFTLWLVLMSVCHLSLIINNYRFKNDTYHEYLILIMLVCFIILLWVVMVIRIRSSMSTSQFTICWEYFLLITAVACSRGESTIPQYTLISISKMKPCINKLQYTLSLIYMTIVSTNTNILSN